ncbi:unnamed protein product [Lupinus luteus]|uniref:Transferring glycosyl group transferase n=1 Tax=Lupinus luteus TaxID=3873 RepID=A0AAV1W7V2_LUPLU
MSTPQKPLSLLTIFFFFFLSPSISTNPPTPSPWPHQFHALLFMNRTNTLQKLDLWYDWPNGRNFNIIQDQLNGVVKYDLEWNNGTSFMYTLDPYNKECEVVHVGVGILRPDWLEGGNYLGQERVDNFLCNVWEKVDFIWYYEDVVTKRPVKWIFYTGYTAHVMTFEVGAVLDDPNWQAPLYCFSEAEKERVSPILEPAMKGGSFSRLMRGIDHTADDM